MSRGVKENRTLSISVIACALSLVIGCATNGAGPNSALHGPDAIAAMATQALSSAGRPRQELFLVYLAPGTDPSGGAEQLVRIFQENNCKDVVITIGSEEPAGISSIVIGALEFIPPGTVDGCEIVVVAPAEAASGITAAANRAGVNLIYAIYPAP